MKAGCVYKNAIVRVPGMNFSDGLTSACLGTPQYSKAIEQHARYCEALQECGLALTILDADLRYPDSTFVEDTAALTARGAILTRPGARSREGEVAAIRATIVSFFPAPHQILAPGTLDGGDVCQAEEHFFIGLSNRTNEEGARQLSAYLAGHGYTCSLVDVRGTAPGLPGILHLKSGISCIGNRTFVAIDEMAGNKAFAGYEFIRVPAEESYAANCVRVNDRVLVAAASPRLTEALVERGFNPLALDLSEFQKMDGGLSCLSLRF
jgi:dimethylargininase